MITREREDIDVLAGEYVLGVLSAAQMRDVERRLPTDRELRTQVSYWQQRLHGLNALAAPLDPDANLWARIERSLAPAPAAPVRPRRERVWFWQLTTAVGVAASLVLALFLFFAQSAQPEWVYTAVLEAPDKTAGWLVQANATNEVRLTPLARTGVESDRALQFWTLADPKQGPVSLGLVPADKAVRIPGSKLPGVKPGQLFEITLEPSTGSPYNRPSGPVLFKGYIVATG